ncbi:hypothetical protein P3X46_005521 [Hevea brasiliensis]|uniref:Pectinesterase inhibitor domain-containing protein n=1 Tax=Hevea brasiliensis TaxID=3981 RepID=A0ABQ9N2I4_HEVBR|nr:putative invertase inhibitor [Hevea brasiliensis]KAJ9185953.1 hypothetical protein P3X46_005521 [Hevea brasiliensis]
MSFSILFFFLLVLAIPTHQTSDLVTKTCDQTLYKDLCNSALASAPESEVTDVQSLAKFALKMTSLNAVEIHKRISLLFNTSSDEFIKQCLTDCSEIYTDATDQLEDSMVALDFKSYNDVNTWVTAAMTDAQSCEDGFNEKSGIVSPLSDINKKFTQLCSISLAITNLLDKN